MKLYTVGEISELLNCSIANTYSLLEKKELGCIRVGATGGGIRVSDVQLEAFLEARRELPGRDAQFSDTNPVKQIKLRHLN